MNTRTLAEFGITASKVIFKRENKNTHKKKKRNLHLVTNSLYKRWEDGRESHHYHRRVREEMQHDATPALQQTSSTQVEAFRCMCGLVAHVGVAKIGYNRGRQYYACPRSRSSDRNEYAQRCALFTWCYALDSHRDTNAASPHHAYYAYSETSSSSRDTR